MLEISGSDALRLDSTLRRRHQVTFSSGILDPANPVLRDCIGDRGALVVCTPSVERLYGRQLKAYLSTLPGTSRIDLMVLDRTESTKTLDAAVEVCDRASDAGLRRTSPIVAVGGGVVTDICGLAAALYRRGVPHIKVPTTLVGLVDAGIGTKNAVNHRDRKSALGSFHPPEHSVLDPGFLATLPRRHLVNGLAEVIKLAIVSDRKLFRLLEEHGTQLAASGLATPPAVGSQVVRLSVTGMLSELSENLFETLDYRRKVDFGHTFSPYIEVASGHEVLHGEAVAMDITLSCRLGRELGLLTERDLDRVLSVLLSLGLSPAWPATSADALWATLPNIADHRNGDLHLVVPTGIGSCTYVGMEAISPQLLASCHEWLLGAAGRFPSTPAPAGSSLDTVGS